MPATAPVKTASRRGAAPRGRAGSIPRERVAEAALALMTEGGIRAVTRRAVARQLGIPVARLGPLYPSDASILTALLDDIEAKLLEHIRMAAQGGSAIERLEGLVLRACDTQEGDARLLAAAFAAALGAGIRHRAPRERLVSILMSYLKNVADIVREGQRAGQIRSDVDAGTIALMYLGLVQPAAILSHVSAGDFNLRNHVLRSFALLRETIGA